VRNRVTELVFVPASDLRPNPKNWRTHPKAQREALRGILAEVGVADACLARRLPDGSLMLIDGHLRAETITDDPVPVLVLNVTEAESDRLLFMLDPLSALAGTDAAMLEELLGEVSTESAGLVAMYERLGVSSGLDPRERFRAPDGVAVPCTCPRCGSVVAVHDEEADGEE
jgi:hypothetical protein